MNIEERKQALECLSQEWQACRPEYYFTDDGIMGDAESYLKSPLRIAFLLKESHSDYVKIRGTVQCGCDGTRPFWHNLGHWTAIIKSLYYDKEIDFQHHNEMTAPIEPIAYINVKKNNQNCTVSKDRDIQKYAIDDKLFLRRQLELIHPNVIVCCGRLQMNRYRDIYDLWGSELNALVSVSTQCYTHDRKILIEFDHPGWYRKSEQKQFEKFFAICKGISTSLKQLN